MTASDSERSPERAKHLRYARSLCKDTCFYLWYSSAFDICALVGSFSWRIDSNNPSQGPKSPSKRFGELTRLLHLPTTVKDEISYDYRPCTPWEPYGKMDTKNCALRVASNLYCARHQLLYNHWNWELEDDQVIQDEGFSMVTTPVTLDVGPFAVQKVREIPRGPLDKEKLQEVSWEASLDIFRWFVINGGGFPPEPIYKDDWLESLGHEDSDEGSKEEENGGENISDALLQERDKDLKLWLGTIE